MIWFGASGDADERQLLGELLFLHVVLTTLGTLAGVATAYMAMLMTAALTVSLLVAGDGASLPALGYAPPAVVALGFVVPPLLGLFELFVPLLGRLGDIPSDIALGALCGLVTPFVGFVVPIAVRCGNARRLAVAVLVVAGAVLAVALFVQQGNPFTAGERAAERRRKKLDC